MIEVEIEEISVSELGYSVFLKPLDESYNKVLPIFIGKTELQAIHFALAGEVPPRPLTHDLFIATLDQFSIQVSQVNIISIIENTFYAELELMQTSSVVKLDARPSDCIALALRHNAPIFLEEAVYEEAGVVMNFEDNSSSEQDAIEDLINPSELDKLFDEVLSGEDTEFENRDESDEKEDLNKEDFKSQEEVLRSRLDYALKHENFEDAALLRDQLKALQNEN